MKSLSYKQQGTMPVPRLRGIMKITSKEMFAQTTKKAKAKRQQHQILDQIEEQDQEGFPNKLRPLVAVDEVMSWS